MYDLASHIHLAVLSLIESSNARSYLGKIIGIMCFSVISEYSHAVPWIQYENNLCKILPPICMYTTQKWGSQYSALAFVVLLILISSLIYSAIIMMDDKLPYGGEGFHGGHSGRSLKQTTHRDLVPKTRGMYLYIRSSICIHVLVLSRLSTGTCLSIAVSLLLVQTRGRSQPTRAQTLDRSCESMARWGTVVDEYRWHNDWRGTKHVPQPFCHSRIVCGLTRFTAARGQRPSLEVMARLVCH
jgi:hypothetical protein